jgi:hypothetical protein
LTPTTAETGTYGEMRANQTYPNNLSFSLFLFTQAWQTKSPN